MTRGETEKRDCGRFSIPGATVSFRKKKLLSKKKGYDVDYCPVLDISLGGVRFLSQSYIKENTELSLKIDMPDEDLPLRVEGRVVWGYTWGEKSFKYQFGVRFNPYGRGKGENHPDVLRRIQALESLYCNPEETG